MSPRRVGLLVLAAIAITVLALWPGRKPSETGGALAGTKVFPDARAQINEITELRVLRGDGAKTTLRRGKHGWEVAERGYPADSGKVRRLLLDLTGLEVVEEKTHDPASYALLGVEDVAGPQATGVRVEFVSPQATRALIVGKPSGSHASFVRVVGQPASLLARPQLMVDASPRRWLDTTLIDVDAARVQRVEVTPASGPAYVAIREHPGAADLRIESLPKGRELSGPGIATALASGLDDLALDDVRAADPAAAPGPLHARVSTFDGLVVELTGHKDGTHGLVTIVARHDDALARRFADPVKTASPHTAPDVGKEAAAIAARTRGWQFELPGWKFDAIFRPLEEMLKPR